ncbi:MAG: radical SAM protein [Patescibacteria group bacterium]|nr:radical SAM protein [Patescibacteria group bacterium]
MCSYICNKQNTPFIDVSSLNKFIKSVDSEWPYISITGGEPLFHPELDAILRTAKGDKRFVTLTTNGVLLKEKAKIIAESSINTLIVSLDGPGKIHDKIRGIKGTYKKATDGIKTILSYEKRPLVFINCSINSLNFNKLNEVKKIAENLGVDGINFQHLWFLNKDSSLGTNQKIIPKDLREFDLTTLWEELKKLKSNKIAVNIFPKLSFFEIVRYYQTAINFKPRFTNKGTDCPWHHMIIKTNGDIIQCNKYIMGNIENQSFEKIWNGSKYRKFRASFLRKGRYLPECIRCCNYFRD